MCKILIEIEGGAVQRITTDSPMQIVVVDRDNDIDDKRGFVSHYEPDTILPCGEKFSTEYAKSIDSQDQEISEILKSFKL